MALAIFEVMRALETRSPKQMPAPHRLVLLVLADHARDSNRAWPSLTRLAAMTGLGRSTVVRCLDDLEAAGWIERQGLASTAPGGRATTLYAVRSEGRDVGRAAAQPRTATTSPAAGLVPERDQSRSGTSAGAGRQGSRSGTPGVPERDARGPGAGHKDLRESPIEAPSEDHPPAGGCAPAGAARGDGPEAGTGFGEPATSAEPEPRGIDAAVATPGPGDAGAAPGARPDQREALGASLAVLPGLVLEPPAPPPAKAARRSPRSPRSASGTGGAVKKAHERYAEAYARGQSSVTGEPFAPPTDSHAEYLFRKVLPVYAIGADGQRLEGDALGAWIEASSAEYRRATGAQPQYQGGFHPRKWADWLGAGKPRAAAHGGRVVQFQGGRTDPSERAAHQRKRAAELALHLDQDGI